MSANISQSLVQLLVLRCSVSAGDRLTKASGIAAMIDECAGDKESQIEAYLQGLIDDDAGEDFESIDDAMRRCDVQSLGEALSDELFGLLSTCTMPATALALLAIVEKALLEVRLIEYYMIDYHIVMV